MSEPAAPIDFRYRPDVDGLRAVAVGLVLLFHAKLKVHGGYVGVDVFFVISGFLITGLILKGRAAGTFRLRDFWARRVRRILPAALVLSLTTLIVGSVLLLPRDALALAKSSLAHLGMAANFWFWKTTDYFGGPADLKPLLHTWSLAVEEQFYLILPLVLAALLPSGNVSGRRFRMTGILLALAAAASLGLSEWLVHTHAEAGFFLLPSRAWELLIGGLLWFLPAPRSDAKLRTDAVALCGLLLIGGSALVLRFNSPFPGLAALPACLGTALVIHSGRGELGRVHRLLAWRPVVGIGLISYSLYLWHWPLFAFARYVTPGPLSVPMRLALLAISFPLAWLSWRWIEQPFRNGERVPFASRVVPAVAGLMLLIAVGSVACVASDGFAARFTPTAREILRTMDEMSERCRVTAEDLRGDSPPLIGNPTGPPRVLLWGDSHAMVFSRPLGTVLEELGVSAVQATRGGTLPLAGYRTGRMWEAPPEYDTAVLEAASRESIRVVVLVGYWSRDAGRDDFSDALLRTVAELRSRGLLVVLVRDVPDQSPEPAVQLLPSLWRGAGFEQIGVTLAEHREQQAAADRAIDAAAESPGVFVFDPALALVDESGFCPVVVGDTCLYWDNDHLTASGADRLREPLRELFADPQLRAALTP